MPTESKQEPLEKRLIEAIKGNCISAISEAIDSSTPLLCSAFSIGVTQGLVEATPKWIAVDEQNPRVIDRVLMLTSGGEMFVGARIPTGKWLIRRARGEQSDAVDSVTHWMPLPPAPAAKS